MERDPGNLFDTYQDEVVSFAILGDQSPSWRPETFKYGRWGCQLAFKFPIVKLWDYNEKRSWLEQSDQLFATVVLAHLETRATRDRPEDRLRAKMTLVRRLYRQGRDRKTILELFRFIDWLMALPVELEKTFQQQLAGLEKELSMRYITSIERMGIEKGLAQGIQRGREQGLKQGVQKGLKQGQARLLRRMLVRRFESLPSWAEDRLQRADLEQLEHWADSLLGAEHLEDVFGAD